MHSHWDLKAQAWSSCSASHLQLSLVVFILPGQEVDLLEQLLLMVLQLTHGTH